MNKTRRLLIVIFIHLFVCIFLCVPTQITAWAQENDGQEKLNDSILEQIGELDLEGLEKYIRSLGAFSDESIADRLISYIKGDGFSYEDLGKEMTQLLFSKIQEVLPSFACIAAIAILSGIISTLKSGTAVKTSADMIYFVSFTAALIPLIAVLTECFSKTLGCVGSMQTQMQLIFPIMLTLMAASGGTSSVQIAKPAVAFFSQNIVSLVSSVVLPFTVTIIAFSIAGSLSKELKITKFTAFFKSINKWVIGICVSVFGLFFTLYGVTSSTYDGIVRRAAKYAIGSGIPIVGGFLSGGFDLAVAGSVLIKNSLGSLSIFLMATVLFEPLVLLIATNLLLRFTSAITQPFGDSRISNFLSETAENMNYCTASLLFTAFMYFLSIIILLVSTEALL